MSTLAIVFGAGGRLGKALLPKLTASGLTPLAVTRAHLPAAPTLGTHRIRLDLIDAHQRARAQPVLHGVASTHHRVILLDLVLDRRSVAAMRRSIAASTSYILGLGRRLAADGHDIRYVLASTTAVLAPRLFQTPYGLAKQRRLATYLGAAQPTVAVLLPSLSAQPSIVADRRSDWCYGRAAGVLARQAELTVNSSRLLLPAAEYESMEPGASGLGRGAIAQLARLTWRRDDPLTHRQASHTRLLLVPGRWRPLVDHHCAPDRLARRAAHRHRVAVERITL